MPRHFCGRSRSIAEAFGLAGVSFVGAPNDIPAAFRQVEVPQIVMLHCKITGLDYLLIFQSCPKVMNKKWFFEVRQFALSMSQKLARNLY
jgi:hypothetical protein